MNFSKLIFFILFYFYVVASHSQAITIPYLIDVLKVQSVPQYKFISSDVVKIPMSFAKYETDSNLKKNISLIQSGLVTRIDLIYTKYKLNDTFNQKKLNTNRLKKLYSIAPGLFNNALIEWNIIQQDDCPDEEKSKKLYHGFAIYLTKPTDLIKSVFVDSTMTIKGTSAEISFIKNLLNKGVYDIAEDKIPFKTKVVKKKLYDTVYTGKYYPNSNILNKVGYMFKTPGKNEREAEYDVHTKYYKDTVLVKNELFIAKYNFWLAGMRDSSLSVILDRNKDWNNSVIIQDVTSSMYPYTAQLFIWRRMQMDRLKCTRFIFFNDGDYMPDGVIGKSGGIYPIESTSIEEVEKLAYKAMENGTGGGIPEANIEPLIKAQELYKTANNFILLADNQATVRDIELLYQLKIPVHIILCGPNVQKIQPDYIRIAYKTNGSIHTYYKDYNHIKDILDKGYLDLGKLKYAMISGKLTVIKN